MILQHLALRSGIEINVTKSIEIPKVKDIESAPELASALLVHAKVYKKTEELGIVSIEKLFTIFTDIQRHLLIENNQAIQLKEDHFDHGTLVKLKSVLNDVLIPLQNTFAGCLRHTHHGDDDVVSCIEESTILSRTYQKDFLIYYDRITLEDYKLTHNEIYKIWANLASFRNYAVLRVKMFLVLFSSYQKVGDKSARLKLGYFSDQMVNELGVYLKYMQSVERIFIKEHKPEEHHQSTKRCTKEPVEGKVGRGVRCQFKICQLSSDDCEVKVAVFTKESIQEATRFEADTKDPFEAGQIFATIEAERLAEQYHVDMEKILHESWNRRMHILYEIFAALKDATLVQNRRFINDCLKQNYSFKGKQKQTKNLNAVKSQIEELKLKRQQHQTKFSHFKDEL